MFKTLVLCDTKINRIMSVDHIGLYFMVLCFCIILPRLFDGTMLSQTQR